MTQAQKKAKIARLLLAEFKAAENAGWWYISMTRGDAEKGQSVFVGGFLIYALGPTDAWCRLHNLNLWEEGCETCTTGPVEPQRMLTIPEEMRWRKLSLAEVNKLGT